MEKSVELELNTESLKHLSALTVSKQFNEKYALVQPFLYYRILTQKSIVDDCNINVVLNRYKKLMKSVCSWLIFDTELFTFISAGGLVW